MESQEAGRGAGRCDGRAAVAGAAAARVHGAAQLARKSRRRRGEKSPYHRVCDSTSHARVADSNLTSCLREHKKTVSYIISHTTTFP